MKPESVLTLLPMPLLQIRTFPPPLCTLRARPLSISATLMDTTLPPVLVDQVPPQVIKCIYVTIVAVCVLTLLSDCWCKASLKHCSASLLSSMARSSRQMCIPHHITSTHPISLFPASYQDGSAHGHCTHWYSAWIGWSLYIKSLFFFQYQDQIQTATAHVKVQRIAMEGKHQECPTHQGWVPCPLEQGRTCSFPLSRPTMCGPRHHPHY